ncbi:hypothetical protein BaRGS_00001624 [Batillaria attramentaria]|uniref:Secreted protein n=1 Tax=Batillaria attramentaria TaxID=370345 RepID=A0ABD0M7B9_9CAEN
MRPKNKTAFVLRKIRRAKATWLAFPLCCVCSFVSNGDPSGAFQHKQQANRCNKNRVEGVLMSELFFLRASVACLEYTCGFFLVMR